MEQINFDTVISELSKGVSEVTEKELLGPNCENFILTKRRISLGSPRQTGKTTFLLNKLLESNSILIATDTSSKDHFLSVTLPEHQDRIFGLLELTTGKAEALDRVKKYNIQYVLIDNYSSKNEWLIKPIVDRLGKDVVFITT